MKFLKEHYKLLVGKEISAIYPEYQIGRCSIFYETRFIGTRKSMIRRACTNHRHDMHDTGQYTFLASFDKTLRHR